MRIFSPSRDLRFTLTLGLSLACATAVWAQRRAGGGGMRGQPSFHQAAPQGFRQSAPAPMRQAPAERRGPQGPQSQLAPIVRRNPQAQAQGEKGEHLAQWMNQHRNLTPQQQQQALDREPGFRQLPQATQQRMHNRLTQLNSMPPGRRERILNYNERMEHMSPEQRGQVRGSLQQLGALPQDQRRQVAQAWRNLRDLTPEQRAAAMNSPQYQDMNQTQRSTLNNLLRVSPLLPPTDQQPPQ